MKAVPPKLLALGLTCLVCVWAVFLVGSRSGQAEAGSLQVESVAQWSESGQIELSITWRWDQANAWSGWRGREELLAVSFDTRSLVWVEEEAPAGAGARGETLRRLDRYMGGDGARRLFTLSPGQDGHVRLRFLPKTPGSHTEADPFRIYVVYAQPASEIWTTETALPGAVSQIARY